MGRDTGVGGILHMSDTSIVSLELLSIGILDNTEWSRCETLLFTLSTYSLSIVSRDVV